MIRKSFKASLIKLMSAVLTAVLVSVLFSSCGSSPKKNNPYRDIGSVVIEEQVVASNSDYELIWSPDPGAVLLKSLSTGKVWSDMCYGAYQAGNTGAVANSAVEVTILDTVTMKWDTVSSYTALEDSGYITCKKIENGIRITYFFERYKIAVPIEYRLRSDSLSVSVNSSAVLEDAEKYKLIAVSVAPFMCSTVNRDSDENYLFVPTGSGALMYSKETPEGTRNYSGEVYGDDYARRQPENDTNAKAVRLPVFGSKDGDTAMLGIIEEGAGAAFIEAQAGNERIGYSQVNATFYLRGYDEFYIQTLVTGNAIFKNVADNITVQDMEVVFYPLYGDKADYNGMAEKYREYLLKNNDINKSNVTNSPYSISIWGGTRVPVSILGIPSTKLVSMTDFKQSRSIVSDLIDSTGISPAVRMLYYGDNGLLPGTIAGDKDIPSVFGKKKDLKTLSEYCKKNSSLLFMDMEIIKYSKAGNGSSGKGDTTVTAIHSGAYRYSWTPLRQVNGKKHYYIKRSKLKDIALKAVKKADIYNLNGIAYSSLGSHAYSDYSESGYEQKLGIEKDAADILKTTSDKGYITAVSDANSYVAGKADVLFDITVGNGGYNVFDEEIPFYQMIFHSYKPMYSEAVNLNEKSQKAVMDAVISGMGLSYSVANDYVGDSQDFANGKLYGILYDDVKSSICNDLTKNNFAKLYDSISQAVFYKYELLGNGLTASYFDDGTVIYANHGENSVNSPVGLLEAYEYAVK